MQAYAGLHREDVLLNRNGAHSSLITTLPSSTPTAATPFSPSSAAVLLSTRLKGSWMPRGRSGQGDGDETLPGGIHR